MKSAEEFIKDLKPLPKQKITKQLSEEDRLTMIDIIEYLLSHREELNYSKRIFQKLENVLADLLKRGV